MGSISLGVGKAHPWKQRQKKKSDKFIFMPLHIITLAFYFKYKFLNSIYAIEGQQQDSDIHIDSFSVTESIKTLLHASQNI